MPTDATLEIITIPCLSDNYAFLLVKGQDAVLVDVPEAAPINEMIAARGLRLDSVWLTHHHDDHVQGLGAVLAAQPDSPSITVYGAKADAHRLPQLDRALQDDDHFDVFGHDVQVMDVSGHTVGHIAYYVRDAGAAFTGDSLMAMGCGRLFEGTAAQMWPSLSKLSALPPETLICSGHEYTAANARFAETIEPESEALKARVAAITAARNANKPTVPSLLSDEQATNPFLRAHLQVVKDGLGMSQASDVDVFAEIRGRKDRF